MKTSCSPKTLADLPTEMIATILQCLTEVKDLKEAVLVCRQWNQLASEYLYKVDAELLPPKCTSWALKKQRTETIRRAIEYDAERFDMDSIRLATGLGDVNFVKELLKSPRFRQKLQEKQPQERHAQPLVEAIKRGHYDMAVLLLENGIDVDQRDHFGNYPLHAALQKGYFALAEMLLDRRAWTGSRSQSGARALDLAVKLNHTVIVKRMLDPRLTQNDLNCALTKAVEAGFVEMVRLLLEAGGDPNTTFDLGENLIRASAILGDAEIFKTLVEHGGVIDDRLSNSGLTVLHQANHVDIAKMIIDSGVPVDILSSDLVTPLLMALGRNNGRVAEALLDAGADPKARTRKGKTTLDLAISGRQMLGLINRLKKCGISTSEPQA